MSQDKSGISIGSLAVSVDSHTLLNDISTLGKETKDAPFPSIVAAFRFAFALGLSSNRREKIKGEPKTISPRQFVAEHYLDLLEEEALKEDTSLGALISEYAEGGCEILQSHLKSGKSVFQILDNMG